MTTTERHSFDEAYKLWKKRSAERTTAYRERARAASTNDNRQPVTRVVYADAPTEVLWVLPAWHMSGVRIADPPVPLPLGYSLTVRVHAVGTLGGP